MPRPRPSLRHAPPLALLTLLAACFEPPVDDPRSAGGNAFDPSGVVRGTVQYGGPAPPCDAAGRPLGRAVLTLFRYDDPPPPQGTATSARNLLVVPGSDLFDRFDCASEEGDPRVIVRSAPFVWPDLTLGESYQIRAFYDVEGDFVPFFPETNQPTAGDVVGGAVEPDGTFRRIVFDGPEQRPDGQSIDGVTVSVSQRQWTERPVFALDARPVPSDARFPLTTDPLAVEEALFALADARLRLLDPEAPDVAAALAATGIGIDPAAPFRAWALRGLDLDADGAADAHPTLPGVPWITPIVQLVRLPAPGEVAMPPVVILGSPRPSDWAERSIVRPALDALVAPVALVDLVPGRDECRVPYLAPGNVKEAFEAGPRECQELPTGRYSVTVLQGLAGGTLDRSPPAGSSDVGLDVTGARLSAQSWTVPNALGRGPADPTSTAWSALPTQGLGGTWVVSEENADDGVGPAEGRCERAPSVTTGGLEPVRLVAPPEGCCDAVRALCTLPLCPAVPIETPTGEAAIRAAAPDGDAPCVPFLPPATCCAP